MDNKINYFSFKKIYKYIPREDFLVFMFTFFANLITHMYMYTNQIFIYDACHVYDASDGIANGRFLINVIMPIFLRIQSPWIFGLMFSACLAGSVVIVKRILDVKGCFTTVLLSLTTVSFPVVFFTHIFIGSLPIYGAAILLSSLSVYFLSKGISLKNIIFSVLCIIAFLACYQAYISYAISLFLIFLMKLSFENENFSKIFKKLGIATLIFIFSIGIYYLLWKGLQFIVPCESTSYRGEDSPATAIFSNFFTNIITAYGLGIGYPITRTFYRSNITIVVWFATLIISFINTCAIVLSRKISIIVLSLGLPLGLVFIYILNPLPMHQLMMYSLIVPYYLFIYILENTNSITATRVLKLSHKIIAIPLIMIVCANTIIGNASYVKNYTDLNRSLSVSTRIVDKIERFEGVKTNSNVIFIEKQGYSWFCMTETCTDTEEHTVPKKFNNKREWTKLIGSFSIKTEAIGTPYIEALIWYIQDNCDYIGLNYFSGMDDFNKYKALNGFDSLQSFPAENCIMRIDENTILFCL